MTTVVVEVLPHDDGDRPRIVILLEERILLLDLLRGE